MNTRKKGTKGVYKDAESEEGESGDFSASESEAEFEENGSSEDSEDSAQHFAECVRKSKRSQPTARPKQKFAKKFLSRLTHQATFEDESEPAEPAFSVKDLTEEDKLLPAVLNLSESDSSDDDESRVGKVPAQRTQNPGPSTSTAAPVAHSESEEEVPSNYTDVWSKNAEESSEEVAKKSFQELQQHTDMLQRTRATIERYRGTARAGAPEVRDLLALGEAEKEPEVAGRQDSGSEMEDWEEVKDSKPIPQSGIQLIVDFPGAATKKSKQLDVEMMMRRKINRVKKEYQVYMHKVHVLCWLGHGNFVNRVLNDQDVMAAALSLLPSEKSYPSKRVDISYLIEISEWYRQKIKLKPDKHENKFKPNAPPLKEILLKQIKNQVVTSTKLLCYIFVSMLRALGIQCRVMMNFVTVPIRPPNSELCSLATKHKMQEDNKESKSSTDKSLPSNKPEPKKTIKKPTATKKQTKIPQLDGNNDSFSSLSGMEYSDNDQEDFIMMQLDGNDDGKIEKRTRGKRLSPKSNKNNEDRVHDENEDVSPPKRSKKLTAKSEKQSISTETKKVSELQRNSSRSPNHNKEHSNVNKLEKHEDAIGNKSLKCEIKEESNGTSKPPMKKKNIKSDGNISTTHTPPTESFPNLSRTKKAPKNKTESTETNTMNIGGLTRSKNCQRKASESVTLPVVDNMGTGNSNKCKSPAGDGKEDNQIIHEVKSIKRYSAKIENKETSKSQGSRQSRNKSIKNKNDDLKTIESQSENMSGKISSDFFQGSSKTKHTRDTVPKILVTSPNNVTKPVVKEKPSLSRKRGRTSSPLVSKEHEPSKLKSDSANAELKKSNRTRTKSAPSKTAETSKYFTNSLENIETKGKSVGGRSHNKSKDDTKRVCHRDLPTKSPKKTAEVDVKKDLVSLIKGRVREAKIDTKKKIVKGKANADSDNSDYLPEEPKRRESMDDFKATKISPKARVRNLDRRVLSSDEDSSRKKLGIDVWCEVFVEDIEQWVSVDVVKPQVHCTEVIYSRATHPVGYIVGWGNDSRLKDLTRRYVPHWNTATRKLRAGPAWWAEALRPWLGARIARDREEDEQLDKIMYDAPLPKSIAEYKNHPLYALKRHLLKFEALYPADAPPLGFVRGEEVYARACVHTCRSRDTWLKEAKTVRRGEVPYKVVKARPKWDRLSNKVITDIPLEVFGPWQVQDYEPPTAEGGVVPRNAYGNVELFKDCMLPKGTVHIKLPGLNKTAKKLNIDCAPAMTGFDFHGGWTHPVFDGFVVCSEHEQLLTDAWREDQEEMERREREKIESRVYGNWKRLIKGLWIRERLQRKYAFGDPDAAQPEKKKGPRFLAKKK